MSAGKSRNFVNLRLPRFIRRCVDLCVQYLLEHFAVCVAALTGVLAARGKQVDMFGVLVLALVTSFGGGTVRDVLLGKLPVFWMADQSFVLNASVTALVAQRSLQSIMGRLLFCELNLKSTI